MVIQCTGKIIVTGMGKSGHIAKKIAATFASLGTPAFYIHSGEAMHGDLGMISEQDILLVISYSGESEEVVTILPSIRLIGAKIIGITGNANSTLAKLSDIVQILPKFEEACYLGLAPTSSTTAVLCYGDALAVIASEMYGYKDIDFGKNHPAGILGKKILVKVDDLMAKDNHNAIIHEDGLLKDAIVQLSKKGLGMVSVVDADNHLLGVITDGDLRRQLEKGADVYNLKVQDVMTRKAITIHSGELAIKALEVLKEKNISCMPVVLGKRVIGTIRLQDIIGIGIVG